ncbi:MAG: T9SS type A sorting domain-containing protein [Chlorobi bacterium]|nr:T9SS type A sorting domain-containing protein [Chlorobiota bacterium]
MKKIYLSLLLTLTISLISRAQIPDGYYDDAAGLTGQDLKTALYNIISSHNNIGYDGLWELYKFSDIDRYYENDGTILDMYSEDPSGTDPYNYTPGSDQCGNYSGEGSCYNREHSFPKSWFNDANPMYSDAFHIFPTDGYVNSKRSNYPYGEIDNPTWTSQNGSKLGPCSYPGYTGTVFEPVDEFKGDLARAYFYMATCYENEIASWETNTSNADAVLNGTSYPCFESWFLNMLLEWHEQDPVSQREIDRNNAVYYGDSNGNYAQGNRNPYIDHPEWVNCIWADDCSGIIADPGNFTASAVSETQINLSWSLNADDNNVLLAYNTENTFGTPSGSYTSGESITGGGEVIYTGNATSFSHQNLSPQIYYYKIWSLNESEEYSNGTVISASPLYPEPSENVTNFTVSNETSNTVTLTWTDAGGTQLPDAYLIKANTGSITPPVDGTPEADGSFEKNINYGVQTVTFTGLSASTTYYFEIFPYTNSGSDINYKTDNPASAIGQTEVAPAVIIDEDFSSCPASGWITYSVSGSEDWECGTDSYMYINAYQGDAASNDWFISPSVNLDNYSGETLTFNTYTKYSDGNVDDPEVILKYSTDYTGSGNPDSATWTEIPYTYPAEDSQTWTSSGNIDLSAINGNSVYIAYQYTSSGTGAGTSTLWELDDIYLEGTPLPATDNDTEILPPSSQIPSNDISSLSDSENEAVNVFSFVIEDMGTSDGTGTNVYNFRFYPAPDNTADWTNNIQGITLSNNGTDIPLISQNITDNYINIQTNPFTVNDASSETFTLSVYLNTENIEDNKVLAFMIDADNHNFISDNQTSGFAATINGGNDIISEDFNIKVDANNVTFEQQPVYTEINTAMSPAVTIIATDENGNIDTDYSEELTLTSTGVMTGDPLSGTWNTGIASFDNITHTETGKNLRLNAASGTFSAQSDTFSVYCLPEDVSNMNISCGSESSNISWENPSSCFDNLILVVNDAEITGTPSGEYIVNSSNYTDPDNPDFPDGGKVLYSGTGTSETVTGLTNNIRYYFKIFVNGDETWTEGTEQNCEPTSIERISESFKLYPNPAKETVTITSEGYIKSVKITNILGKEIEITNNINSNTYTLKLNSLPEGIYLIEITNNYGLKTVKQLIKE